MRKWHERERQKFPHEETILNAVLVLVPHLSLSFFILPYDIALTMLDVVFDSDR